MSNLIQLLTKSIEPEPDDTGDMPAIPCPKRLFQNGADAGWRVETKWKTRSGWGVSIANCSVMISDTEVTVRAVGRTVSAALTAAVEKLESITF